MVSSAAITDNYVRLSSKFKTKSQFCFLRACRYDIETSDEVSLFKPARDAAAL